MKTNKDHERKREEFDRLCEENFRTVSSTSKTSNYINRELTNRLVANTTLIKTLKTTNAEKDKVINRLTSNLVFVTRQVTERDKSVQQLKDMI